MLEMIRSIQGTEFLIMYLVYCIIIIFAAKVVNTMMNGSLITGSSNELDVYSMTVLRNGSKPTDIANTMLFKLCAEGYLESKEESGKMLFQKTNQPTDDLLPIENTFLKFFSKPRKFSELIPNKNNIKIFEAFGDELKENLANLGFVKSRNQHTKEKRIRLVFYGIMLSLGLTKFFLGLANNKPASYLFFEMLFMTIVFFIFNRVAEITSKGKAYLQGKTDEYSWVRNHKRNTATNFHYEQAAVAVALFGVASMYTFPEFGMIARAAQPQNIGGSSSGGYSCSSSGCSSSGCSSSGGSSSGCSSSGCSGGGCGGCGGGGD